MQGSVSNYHYRYIRPNRNTRHVAIRRLVVLLLLPCKLRRLCTDHLSIDHSSRRNLSVHRTI